MKILLDECIPRKFKNSLADHECLTVPEAGLAGKKNGELLSIAEHQGYTIFLTMDKGVEYEQNLKHRSINHDSSRQVESPRRPSTVGPRLP
jgi:predicted nuclease of predicted toxin-antitoxin system